MALSRFDVIINGRPLGGPVRSCVDAVTVDQRVDLPGMFTLDLSASEAAAGSMSWFDDDTFAVGHAVEIKMGNGGELKTLMKGEITALEPTFISARPPSLTVRGYDRAHRLQKGRRTHTYSDQKDSEIAERIASKAGLAADSADSGVRHEYIFQDNQSDLEFLQERARAIHYEVFVEDKTLVFRPAAGDTSVSVSLRLRRELTSFYPRLSLGGQVTSVTVRGWSEKEKKVYIGQAQAGEVSRMGGSESGPEQLESTFGAAEFLISEQPVRDQAEADQLAKARLEQLALGLVSGEGTCRGEPDVRAGRLINLDVLSRRFSGDYYVTAATHRYDQSGYQTDFIVRRNAT